MMIATISIADIAARIDQCFAARPYHPCVLLVHADMHILQDAAQQVAQVTGWPELPVSRVLTAGLTSQPQAVYSMLASTALDRPLAALDLGLQAWLLAVALTVHSSEELPYLDLIRLPELYPFALALTLDDLRRHPWLAVQRQGAGLDMVRLADGGAR